jgi:hypothetical protein
MFPKCFPRIRAGCIGAYFGVSRVPQVFDLTRPVRLAPGPLPVIRWSGSN